MKKNIIVCFLLAALIGWSTARLDAQEVEEAEDDLVIGLSPSAQLALSTADYRITAGDVYTLAYFAGVNSIEYTITVDSTYKIRVSNLGIIDVSGKTFNQVKAQVETIVSNNYPLGAVQFVLRQPAIFKVYIRGEVRTTHEMQVWALSRLSSVLGRNLTAYSSTRDIEIRSSNGQIKTYDLFKANRNGDLSQDPFVRPDDTITIKRLQRKVTLSGAVERPGTYEMLAGENLKQLVELYGNGLTPFADTRKIELVRYLANDSISGDRSYLSADDLTKNYPLQNYDTITIRAITSERPVVNLERIERSITISGAVRRPGTYQLHPDENLKDLVEVYADGFVQIADTSRIELTRYVNSDSISGDKMMLSETDVNANFIIEHLDSILIPSIIGLRPIVFVEGAIGTSVEGGAQVAPEASTRLTIMFNSGETYGVLVRTNRGWFTAVSDTQNAYIIRGAERIPLNLNPYLYDAMYRNDVLIEENDTLIIPFRQYFISVAGAVAVPGRYPYIPDRTWEYYIGLAGGFDPNRNSGEKITITDISGKKMKKDDAITPETLITAESNKFLYGFNQVAPVITTSLTIITTFLSLYMLMNR